MNLSDAGKYFAVGKYFNAVMDAIEALPFGRIVYSLVLVAIILFLLGGLRSSWGRSRIQLADFFFYADGKKNPDYGEQIRTETIQYYKQIVDLIRNASSAQTERDGAANDSTGKEDNERLKKLNEFLTEKGNQLAQIDVTFQGFSIKALLTNINAFIAPRNTEISAEIFNDGTSRRIFLTIAGNSGDRLKQGISADVPSVSLFEAPASDSESARRIACFLIWAQWEELPSRNFGITLDEFCDWAKLLKIKDEFSATDSYLFELVTVETKNRLCKKRVRTRNPREIKVH